MTKKEIATQPCLWPDNFTPRDPEKKLYKFGNDLNSPYYRHQNSPVREEILQNKNDLRNRINLPKATIKNHHANDLFYKFLVKNIVNFDKLSIFSEYDRSLGIISPELEEKLNEIGGFMNEVNSPDLNRQEKFKKYHHFVKEYKDKWNISNMS